MGFILNSKGSLYAMKVLIVKLVVWLGWLSCVAVGQLEVSEAVTGFVNFPEVGISCIGNLAVFITSISKGRLDLEMGARYVLASLRGPELHDINNSKNSRVGLTTCGNYEEASAVMLSYNRPDSTMKQFMKYNSNAHHVQSIFLSGRTPEKTCNHGRDQTICKCMVFEDVKEITDLLVRRMPRTLKRLSDFQCLLPFAGCLTNGCHGCNDCLHCYLYWTDRTRATGTTSEKPRNAPPPNTSEEPRNAPPIMPANTSEKPRNAPPIMPVCAVIVVEIMCIASGSVALGVLGIKPFKKWVYSVVQGLVWVKWGIGSYLLGEKHSETDSEYNWKSGILVYSSSFFLNFMLQLGTVGTTGHSYNRSV